MASTGVSQTVADMRRYYNSGETRSVSFRIEQLRKLKSMIHSHEDEIIQSLHNDLKKPPLSPMQVRSASCMWRLNMQSGTSSRGPVPKSATPIIHFLSSSMIYQEPYGVVLIMGPWNYPFNLLIAPLCGCEWLQGTVLSLNPPNLQATCLRLSLASYQSIPSGLCPRC